jgi:UV DNA damage endonuclease
MRPKRKLATDSKPRASKRAATTAVNLVVNGAAGGSNDTAKISRNNASEKMSTRKRAASEDAPASIDDVKMNGLEESDKEDEEDVSMSVSRPPPVNSDVLPLPWKGRLGYVCMIRTRGMRSNCLYGSRLV